jgi:DivIVA domain-containing protein
VSRKGARRPAIAPGTSTADLIEQIKNVKFGTVRLTPGYAMPDVDAFLEEVARATW